MERNLGIQNFLQDRWGPITAHAFILPKPWDMSNSSNLVTSLLLTTHKQPTTNAIKFILTQYYLSASYSPHSIPILLSSLFSGMFLFNSTAKSTNV